jgi:hypothetical protein
MTIDWSVSTTVTPTAPPPTSTPTPTASSVPTQDLPTQPITQTDVPLGLEWKDLAITASGVVIAGLALVLLQSHKKSVRTPSGLVGCFSKGRGVAESNRFFCVCVVAVTHL